MGHWNRHQKLLICEGFFFFLDRTHLKDHVRSTESKILVPEGSNTTFQPELQHQIGYKN